MNLNASEIDTTGLGDQFFDGVKSLVQGGGTEALIEEFGGYVWDAKAQEHGEDKPLKVNDHCMDALRYVLHSIFGRGTVRAVRGLY